MDHISAAAVILRYHRVTEYRSDPHGICVAPKHFAAQLEVIAQHFAPLTLQELIRCLEKNEIPDRAVVVTFDDGYADNKETARPLLEHYRIPATMFVTTGYLDQQREFWWDRLEHILLQPGSLPSPLFLHLPDRSLSWELHDSQRYSEQNAHEHAWWNWKSKHTPTTRHRVFREMFRVLQPLEEALRDEILSALAHIAGMALTVRPEHRTLGVADVKELAKCELVEVGSHSMTHPLLCALSENQQEAEIQGSKTMLENLMGRPVKSFAYPYGVYEGTSTTLGIVKRLGYACACSTQEQAVRIGIDPFILPRCYVGDWESWQFRRSLTRMMSGLP
jgi:peptidoglycan/xylan/chitin deacetylase (PgdA/CDA1 family)